MAAASTVIRVGKNGPFTLVSDLEPEPVYEWQEGADGKRRPSNVQETVDGKPLWQLQVMARSVSFGRAEPTFFTLQLASRTKPNAEEFLGLDDPFEGKAM